MLVFKVPLPEKFKDLEYWHVTCNFVVLALNNIHGTVKALKLMQQYFPADYADAIAADMKSNYSYPKHVLEYRTREKKDFLNFMCKNVDYRKSYLDFKTYAFHYDVYDERCSDCDESTSKYIYRFIEGFGYNEHEIKYGDYISYETFNIARSYLKRNFKNEIFKRI